ncbi:alpha/beta hydrolase [Myroides ceti]|uniref:Alpha/beta hydrolase n=1 Tax=Paenimyroides ceti TaxID=395087 RepID=A0ABT8CSG1_9FLAO|nr:alpha/beta hydrolase [Paenimyroides ceti]MDN3707433.1 alpha/beta hydrolase [Paenimyroides ceti]
MTKEIYIFSGLGADERVFKNLDFSGFHPVFIKWIIPQKTEKIEEYAKRLLDQIKTTKPILIGLSFGGIIAVEVAKQIKTKNIILLASAKIKNEIPFYYRYFGMFGIHKFLPVKLLKTSNFITNWIFGTKSISEKQLLKEILIDTDEVFLEWAIDKIICWQNKTEPTNIFHIHGTADYILPLCFIRTDAVIKDGGHLMTLNKADEINKILQEKLGNEFISFSK